MAPAGVRKPTSLTFKHAHRKRHLGANRIQLGIERLFGDLDPGEPHRRYAVGSPRKRGQVRRHGQNLDRAHERQHFVGDQNCARRINQQFENRELRRDARLIAVGSEAAS